MTDLKVRIVASLNTGKSIGEINSAIKSVEKKINKIKLNVTIDDNLTKNIEKLINEIKKLNNVTRGSGLPDFTGQLNNAGNQAQQTQRHIGNLGNQITSSFVRGAAISGIYSMINGLQTMADTVVMVDTKLTDLKRVMDSPDYKFNDYLQNSINLSNELGNKLSDVMDMQTQWAQAGYQDEKSLTALTKTAQIMQNISSLNASDSVSTLLSTSINFGIAASDTLEIADRINEVDNNFSTTSADISNSLRKSASAASQYGVSLDDLIGYTTAIKYMSPISVMIYEKIQ